MYRQKIARDVRGPVLAIALVGLAACDFNVTNPGPTLDKYLSDSFAIRAQVNSVGYTLGDGLNYLALQGAVAARELFPTGTSGQFGIEPGNWVGFLVTEEQGTVWNTLQQARWLGDQVVTRIRGILGETRFAKHPLAAQARCMARVHLPCVRRKHVLQRHRRRAAETGGGRRAARRIDVHRGLAVATAANSATLVNAAYAGRAQRACSRGTGMEQRPMPHRATSFTYQMPTTKRATRPDTIACTGPRRRSLYKSHSTWKRGTRILRHLERPRVKYTKTTLVGAGHIPAGRQSRGGHGEVRESGGGINLASGREMRLIEAEAALRAGDITTAIARINALRTLSNAPLVTAPSAINDAWTLLKRERGIELWLEGRRIGDFRRWIAAGTPGELDPLEKLGTASYLDGQGTCFPLSQNEIDTNPNAKP
jgi:hypothetical protein